MVNTLNWVMDNENLYCAVVENKPQHEMEKTLLTIVEELKDVGIVGPKIESSQIHFKIAQIKNSKAFQEKFPEVIAPIISKCFKRIISDIKLYMSIGKPLEEGDLRVEFIESSFEFFIESITFHDSHYFLKYSSNTKYYSNAGGERELSTGKVNRLIEKYFEYVSEDQKARSSQ